MRRSASMPHSPTRRCWLDCNSGCCAAVSGFQRETNLQIALASGTSSGPRSRRCFSRVKVSLIASLSPEGELLGLIPCKIQQQRGKKLAEAPQLMLMPEPAKKASGVRVRPARTRDPAFGVVRENFVIPKERLQNHRTTSQSVRSTTPFSIRARKKIGWIFSGSLKSMS